MGQIYFLLMRSVNEFSYTQTDLRDPRKSASLVAERLRNAMFALISFFIGPTKNAVRRRRKKRKTNSKVKKCLESLLLIAVSDYFFLLAQRCCVICFLSYWYVYVVLVFFRASSPLRDVFFYFLQLKKLSAIKVLFKNSNRAQNFCLCVFFIKISNLCQFARFYFA